MSVQICQYIHSFHLLLLPLSTSSFQYPYPPLPLPPSLSLPPSLYLRVSPRPISPDPSPIPPIVASLCLTGSTQLNTLTSQQDRPTHCTCMQSIWWALHTSGTTPSLYQLTHPPLVCYIPHQYSTTCNCCSCIDVHIVMLCGLLYVQRECKLLVCQCIQPELAELV